jgi:PKD domain-containing protein
MDATSAPMTQMGLAGFCATNCTSWDVSWVRARNAPVPMPEVSNMGFSPLAVGVVASPAATDVGRSESFTCSAAGGSGSYNYSWTFGDSGTGTGRTAAYVYASLGTFEARCIVSDAAGAMGNSTATVVVNPNPAIVLFQALPSNLQLGVSLNLVTNVTGGTPPLRFAYSGLPPGCPTRNSASLSCLPGETGTFAIEVTVTDGVDEQTSSFVTITVAPATVPQNSTPFSPAEGYAIAGAVAGVVVLAGVLPVLWWRRRGPPGGPSEPLLPPPDPAPAEDE